MSSDARAQTPADGLRDLLTTQQKSYDPLWCSRAVVLPGYMEALKRNAKGWSLIDDCIWGWKLFRTSSRYKAVITGSERLSFIFAILQKFRFRKIPHIFMQSMWNLRASRWKRPFIRILLRLTVSSASRVVVYSRRQLELYPLEFGIPVEKLVFLFSHTTLYKESYSSSQGDYVFLGGDSNRDYRTLVEAVRDAPCRVVIVTHETEALKKLNPGSNVKLVNGLSLSEFNRMIARSLAVVVALKPGKIETGGRSVYGNAMALGKPVVVADCDARDYIHNGFDGLVVPPGDVAMLRNALGRVLRDSALRESLGENARHTAKAFAPETFYLAIFDLADRCAADSIRIA
jgi:glycosyltransferase involved in cell wall biosynthesis